MVSGDTGPLHLAAAVGTPIVALFGPTTPSATAHGRLRTSRSRAPTVPCLYRRRCRSGSRASRTSASSEVVAAVRAAAGWLTTSGPTAAGSELVERLARRRVRARVRHGGRGADRLGADVADAGGRVRVVALAGEAIRVWAAGHLEKSREVTRSGPYRWTRHPLYAGSCVIALGVAIASNSVVVAALAAVYMVVTIAAAVRTEEAFLRRRSATRTSGTGGRRASRCERRFSLERAMRNREYRAVRGCGGFGLLALKVVLPI